VVGLVDQWAVPVQQYARLRKASEFSRTPLRLREAHLSHLDHDDTSRLLDIHLWLSVFVVLLLPSTQYTPPNLRMPQDAQRKAWNEAMRVAAGSTLPKALQKQPRRSDRRKRTRARRTSTAALDGDDGYRAAVWLDALEQVDPSQEDQDVEQEEEYNELEDLQQPSQAGGKKRGGRRSTRSKTGQIPKRFKPRSLASILMEETTRQDGIAQAFVLAGLTTTKLPTRPYCSVTGLPGLYREPKTGLSYANEAALEQIRERPPPWTTLSGNAAYQDVVKSFQQQSVPNSTLNRDVVSNSSDDAQSAE
jgi:hypothetical protein